jgi:hypothetical protein
MKAAPPQRSCVLFYYRETLKDPDHFVIKCAFEFNKLLSNFPISHFTTCVTNCTQFCTFVNQSPSPVVIIEQAKDLLINFLHHHHIREGNTQDRVTLQRRS